VRVLCLHGHFYQPPREHPWLGVVEPETSAAPARDWNTRIAAECYAPFGAARILDAAGRLADVVDCYRWTSFDFGPTLLGWLAGNEPALLERVRAADADSRTRAGCGNAWAQAYGHPILPLSSPRDVRTQVLWGRADFEHRFGRRPEGMWLPEMAVDRTSLVALAEAGIALTMLSPHQAARVRPLGAGEDAWRVVDASTLDTRRLYRCEPAPGLALDVCFRDASLSHDIAFGGLLMDGAALARRLAAALEGPDGRLVTVAVDGETFGHHHRFGEMALAFALRVFVADSDVMLAGPAAMRAAHPPTHEVEVRHDTSWSCVHGVDRWRSDCGCRVGTVPSSQAWRAPLRQAIDWLRDELAALYEVRAGEVFRDPWGARDRFVGCLLEPGRTAAFLAAEASAPLSPAATLHGRRTLALAYHALLMQTSCGWFFDDLAGVEPALILRQAARALELAATLGGHLGDGFVARLEPAHTQERGQSGADLFRAIAGRAAATPARVAATGALLHALGAEPELPGHRVRVEGDGRRVEVMEESTGAAEAVAVTVERPPGGVPTARVGDAAFTLRDLFPVQQERLLATLATGTAEAWRAARAAAGGQAEVVREVARAGDVGLPGTIAYLVGWDLAEEIATAIGTDGRLTDLTVRAAALRQRGIVVPERWLAARLERALEARVEALPAGAPAVVELLDLAAAAGVDLDVVAMQPRVFAWWRSVSPAIRASEAAKSLQRRFHLAPEEPA
jgi:alpha-amylase/alpha-mannosidase (GH57 family)